MRRTFFRRKRLANDPSPHPDPSPVPRRNDHRHFGRTGSLQNPRMRAPLEDVEEKRATSDEVHYSNRSNRDPSPDPLASPSRPQSPPAHQRAESPELPPPSRSRSRRELKKRSSTRRARERGHERGRERERGERDHGRDRDRDYDRDRDRDHDRDRDRDHNRDYDRDYDRDYERSPEHHRRERARDAKNTQDVGGTTGGSGALPAGTLEELNKLLETLTSRELQLTLRIDKAEEAVSTARASLSAARAGTREYDVARRRALCALRQKKTLDRSLGVTTEQSDFVLRALGRQLAPLADRIGAAVAQSQLECDELAAEAAALGAHAGDNEPSRFEGNDEQLAREIDDSLRVAESANAKGADASADWLADARADVVRQERSRDARAAGSRGAKRNTHTDPRDAGAETVPEFDSAARVAGWDRARASREDAKHDAPAKHRPPADAAATPPAAAARSRIPRAQTFTQRRRTDRKS